MLFFFTIALNKGTTIVFFIRGVEAPSVLSFNRNRLDRDGREKLPYNWYRPLVYP